MKVHELKCWRRFYFQIAKGVKRFELRKNDRDYQVGDQLVLREYDQEIETLTGRWCLVSVQFMVSEETPCAVSHLGLQPGFCILGISQPYAGSHIA